MSLHFGKVSHFAKVENEELYKNRFKIEQTNDWLDGYKGLIMRYRVYLQVPQKSLNTFW